MLARSIDGFSIYEYAYVQARSFRFVPNVFLTIPACKYLYLNFLEIP